MFDVAKISANGQITVPLAIRKTLGLKEGDKIVFIQGENGVTVANAASIALDRVQKAFEGVAERWRLKDEDDVVETIKKVRREDR